MVSRSGEKDNVFANPRQAQANGDFSAYRFDNVRNDEIRSGEVGLNIEFKTASVGHTIITSASTFSLESENAYAFSDFSGFAGNIYNPVTATMPDADFFIGGDLSNPLITEKTDLSSFALADMISFNDGKVLLTLGGRVQNIETRTFDYNTGDELSGYDESQFTPVVGIVINRQNRCLITPTISRDCFLVR